ncbi:MAG: type secretion system protein VirB3 [Rickettsiaceae bacterium]|jgi:type IV secretion system protein VirB3|nr:type secretion system protein VirB3 [Rickettsiaceae bacterium]
MAGTGELEVDMLFLGLTRPPMLFGVSYTVVLANFFICMMYFVLTSDFKGFGSMPLIHGIAYVLCQKEPLFLELFMLKQQKCNKCKNRLYHGLTNSYDVM